MLSDDLHGDFSTVQCIRAFGFDEPKSVEVVLDSGADGSVLPLAYMVVVLVFQTKISMDLHL